MLSSGCRVAGSMAPTASWATNNGSTNHDVINNRSNDVINFPKPAKRAPVSILKVGLS